MMPPKKRLATNGIVAIVFMVAAATVCVAQTVPSNFREWVDTRIQLTTRTQVQVAASGRVYVGGGFGTMGPEGTTRFANVPGYPAETRYRYGLVVRVTSSSSNPNDDLREDYAYGETHQFCAGPGHLWLTVNDDQPADNTGEFNVHITLGPSCAEGAGPNPLHGRFRVSLNGFLVNHQTIDDVLNRDGWADEVKVINDVRTVDMSGASRQVMAGTSSSLMGQHPPNQIQAGTATDTGGLQTGDGFPTRTPWRRVAPLTGAIPPMALFEDELTQNANVAIVIPTIWESDPGNDRLNEYFRALNRDRANIDRTAAGMISARRSLALSSFLVPGSSLGMGNATSLGHGPLGLGEVNNRPIGMQSLRDGYGFTPQVLVLTFDSAQFLSRTDFGRGRGVIPINYRDDQSLQGDYTLFLQVEEVGTAAACAPDISSTFSGTASLTITNPNVPRTPFVEALELPINFTACRGNLRIMRFAPIAVNFPTQIGDNTTTVTLSGGGVGVFSPPTGQLDLPVTLRFVHSIGPPLAGPSDLTLTLSTGASGALRGGHIRLSGSGTFVGGFLNGSPCTIIVDGTLAPSP